MTLQNVDGVPWYETRLPPVWHKCEPHTTCRIGPYELLLVGRCRCGSYAECRGEWPPSWLWLDRNSRRKERSVRRAAAIRARVGQLIIRRKAVA